MPEDFWWQVLENALGGVSAAGILGLIGYLLARVTNFFSRVKSFFDLFNELAGIDPAVRSAVFKNIASGSATAPTPTKPVKPGTYGKRSGT